MSHAVKPDCQLGVTGHRNLPGADGDLLRTRVKEVLARVAGDGQPLWLATSLAEGADRLVAEIAVALGYSLYCPLPFPAAAYEQDFGSPESLTAFRSLLAGAGRVSIANLPAEASRDDGYTAAGRAMLDASRALLALWDGQPPRGEGGTGQIVNEALVRGLPVLWLLTNPTHELRVRLPGEDEWRPANPGECW